MKSRLKKVLLASELDSFVSTDSPVNNPSAIPPYGIVFRGAEEKVSNDNITKTKHDTGISKEFFFERDVDNPEWVLQNNK